MPLADAVIIGGGLHGLATAYFLAKEHGLTDVAILEKRYIGFGGAGREDGERRGAQRRAPAKCARKIGQPGDLLAEDGGQRDEWCCAETEPTAEGEDHFAERPGLRFDEVERLARSRAKELFGAEAAPFAEAASGLRRYAAGIGRPLEQVALFLFTNQRHERVADLQLQRLDRQQLVERGCVRGR